jgi:hypothetical protein
MRVLWLGDAGCVGRPKRKKPSYRQGNRRAVPVRRCTKPARRCRFYYITVNNGRARTIVKSNHFHVRKVYGQCRYDDSLMGKRWMHSAQGP